MDAKTAIDGMVRASGKTPAEIAEAIGRSRTYVYTLMNQGSVPRLDTFARLAHECGYRLVLETADGSRGVELYADDDKRPKRA
ncbi:MAG: helix-turn-helix transcriptional regulator [Parafannyhessea umbonata]|uniref:helix-turn-helix domain-containing protein n=1 Tax=Parafannyhessea umbonata TaxID=604330 RepID=UPI0026EAE5CB|nr:helix-turn-helix transcriptional regulator [Parafannyhessea umbonata]MDD6358984.1 helix-turn-helix transcriptional regulator [Parafannyhessea umbonata]